MNSRPHPAGEVGVGRRRPLVGLDAGRKRLSRDDSVGREVIAKQMLVQAEE